MNLVTMVGFRKLVGGVIAASLVGGSAIAGEILHFKAGDVNAPSQAASALTRLRSTSGAGSVAGSVAAKAFFVVQFKTVIGAEDRKNLTTLGAQILRYVPDDALIVKADARIAQTIALSSLNIQAVLPFHADWKMSPQLNTASVFTATERTAVLVALFPGETSEKLIAAITALPRAKVMASSDRSVVAELSRAQVETIAKVEGVEWIEPAPRVQSLDMRGLADDATTTGATTGATAPNGNYTDLTGFESGTKLLNVAAAYARGYTGRGQILSMADTGLDSGSAATVHGDFKDRLPVGFSFGLYADSWADPMGHGTHVAGSVMGSGAASGGALRGGSYEASFVPEGMWSPMMEGLTVPTKLSDLFSSAYGAGARIHTNSWGAAQDLGAYDGMASQVDEFMAANPDMLVLFAAGNSGVDADKDGRVDPNSIGSPATAKNVLTVGASKNYVVNGGYQMKLSETRLKDSWPVEPLASSKLSENPQGMAAFSSRGPTQDGRMKPDVVAPGTNILSVHSQVKGAEALWGLYNNDYAWSGGTSMATPVTAGTVGLLRQYLVQGRGLAQPSAALVKAILMHTATDLYPGQFGEVGAAHGQEFLTRRPNVDEGYGRVDIDKATDLGAAILVDEKVGLATGEAHTYPVKVTSAAHLTATLVYTDAAGSASAQKALVNDLDLVLVDQNGVETSLNDHLNNSEMIQADVVAGTYTIKVKGTNVPTGPAAGKQPYALVLSLN